MKRPGTKLTLGGKLSAPGLPAKGGIAQKPWLAGCITSRRPSPFH